jgi:hypothetical protein
MQPNTLVGINAAKIKQAAFEFYRKSGAQKIKKSAALGRTSSGTPLLCFVKFLRRLIN